MDNYQELFVKQLKNTCALTNAKWSVWIESDDNQWKIMFSYGLTKTRQRKVLDFFHSEKNSGWLSGALKNGRNRSRKSGVFRDDFGCRRIFIFPNPEQDSLLIVGADELGEVNRKIFNIVAKSPILKMDYSPSLDGILADVISEIHLGVSYDLSSVLDRVLVLLSRYITCDVACIGLLYGPYLRLEAVGGNAKLHDRNQIVINENPHLKKLIQTRSLVLIKDILEEGNCPLLPDFGHGTGSWIGIPLLVGKRVIGVVFYLSNKEDAFSHEDTHKAVEIAKYVAPSIETVVVFDEVSHHLEKLALLNELASVVSMGDDVDSVAKRIIRRLRKVFKTELVSLLLLSFDGKFLIEFGHGSHPTSGDIIPVENSLQGYVVESGIPVRISDVNKAPRYDDHIEGIRSELAVPLKSRGRVIGVLALESLEPNAFSQRDEQLLVVIASHIAGLIDNIRLHTETRQRAENLELLRQISERVVGLVNISEISQVAAEFMAEGFSYELAAILLIDEKGKHLVLEGVGGQGSEFMSLGYRSPITKGILGSVFQSGVSCLIRDTSLEPDYVGYKGWKAGSVMCVPLRETNHVFGVINVERNDKGSFSTPDYIFFEALAGMLSSIFMNAYRYKELQTNYRHLQAVRETAIDISADLDLDTLFKRVTTRARELLAAKGAELGLVDEDRAFVEIKFSENPWEGYISGLNIPFSSGVAGVVAEKGKSILVDDYRSWEHRLNLDEEPPFVAVAGVPLKYKGETIGTLTVSNDEVGMSFTKRDLQLLELLAPQIAVSVRNARLYQALQEYIEAEKIVNERLVQSARLAAVGEMAAGVAHELNNPLTTVAGFAELILDEIAENSPQRADLELMFREATRAKEVVRRLLDFSRPGEGFRVRSDVNDMAMDVISLIRHLAHTSGIKLTLEFGENLPLIHVDRDQIKQVLLNLVHNAIQSMPRGGVLTLQTNLQELDGRDWITIKVMDTGEGITPDNQRRIFEPFFTTRPPGKGTGLGLAVSYGIIKDHEGLIDVESVRGEGCTFTVFLPLESSTPVV